jgi:hypothetical protein
MTTTLQLTLNPSNAQLHNMQTSVLVGDIAVGFELMTAQHFSKLPLDAMALERAIEWTEDRIQLGRIAVPKGAILCTQADDVRMLAAVAGLDQTTPTLHVDAVENVFSRLVLQAFGQAAPQQALPDIARTFATVVLLRELMHHLGFDHIQVKAKPQFQQANTHGPSC